MCYIKVDEKVFSSRLLSFRAALNKPLLQNQKGYVYDSAINGCFLERKCLDHYSSIACRDT